MDLTVCKLSLKNAQRKVKKILAIIGSVLETKPLVYKTTLSHNLNTICRTGSYKKWPKYVYRERHNTKMKEKSIALWENVLQSEGLKVDMTKISKTRKKKDWEKIILVVNPRKPGKRIIA